MEIAEPNKQDLYFTRENRMAQNAERRTQNTERGTRNTEHGTRNTERETFQTSLLKGIKYYKRFKSLQ